MDAQIFWKVISIYNQQTLTAQIVTYVMPCPVVSLGIIVYAGYKVKNKSLLTLLTIWGLTGIKSIVFNAYEDIILLVCGLYGVI